MILQYIKKCTFLVLMGGISFVGLHGSKLELKDKEKKILSKLEENKADIKSFIKEEMESVKRKTKKVFKPVEFLEKYACDLSLIEAKLQNKGLIDNKIVLIEHTIGVLCYELYKRLNESRKETLKTVALNTIFTIKTFSNITECYYNNLEKLQEFGVRNDLKMVANIKKTVQNLENTIIQTITDNIATENTQARQLLEEEEEKLNNTPLPSKIKQEQNIKKSLLEKIKTQDFNIESLTLPEKQIFESLSLKELLSYIPEEINQTNENLSIEIINVLFKQYSNNSDAIDYLKAGSAKKKERKIQLKELESLGSVEFLS